MKIAQLLAKMKQYSVSLPETGTGKNNKILARDLETALGDYFFDEKYKEPFKASHCRMRRSFIPMKAYRYDKLKQTDKNKLLEDGTEWCAEEKYNGWRIIITYIPDDGFCFWGGNISDVDFLPVDYTEHVQLMYLGEPRHPRSECFRGKCFSPFAFDAEALCFDDVEMLDGLVSNNTLDAVGAILGSSADRAIQMQKEATLVFKCFDCIQFMGEKPLLETTLTMRQACLAANRLCFSTSLSNIETTKHAYYDKQQYLNKIWKAGGEGIILKCQTQDYISGGRLRTHAIKVKRTMSGEIGDDIDAFISGWIKTPEHDKEGLIGGIKLSVFIQEGDNKYLHEIATVTGMPDHVRQQLTVKHYDHYTLNPEYNEGVLVVDGQELSNRNRKIMHAKVDWKRGFRTDKRFNDCMLELNILEEERF
jgi:ATP-dependent DNA ligase